MYSTLKRRDKLSENNLHIVNFVFIIFQSRKIMIIIFLQEIKLMLIFLCFLSEISINSFEKF